MTRRILIISALLAAFLTAPFNAIGTSMGQPLEQAPSVTNPLVTIKTTKGDMVVELDRERAPITVANFLDYTERGRFDRTIFHRVVRGFVIQGGGYSQFFNERSTASPIAYEGGNGLKNLRGTISMARTDDPNSATSQWFINLIDNPDLDHRVTDLGIDYGYAVFGKVLCGIEVADAIGAVETGAGGPFESEVPLEPIVILRVDETPMADE
ncbi:MAG: peptidylprolyl isomerase [Pseudomonadota bacterium]